MVRDYNETFTYDKRGVNVTINRVEGKYRVLKKGSKTKALEYWSNNRNVKDNYYNFYEENISSLDGHGFVREDITHDYPSTLLAFALGKQVSSAWMDLKNKDGRSPNDLYRKKG